MPSWKTHLIFSLFLVVAWMSVFNFLGIALDFSTVFVLVILIIIASLFPDIDMKSSKMRDAFSVAIAALIAVAYWLLLSGTWYYAFVYFILLYLIIKYIPTKHRGITHNFGFSVAFSLALAFLYFLFSPFAVEKFVFWFAIVFSSYSLHLLVDKT